jgi:hypothetical protein
MGWLLRIRRSFVGLVAFSRIVRRKVFQTAGFVAAIVGGQSIAFQVLAVS